MKTKTTTAFGKLQTTTQREQRRWWRELEKTQQALEAVSKQGPIGAALAEQQAYTILSRLENAEKALTLIGGWLGNPGVLWVVAAALELDQHSCHPLDTMDDVWLTAVEEADYLFRGHGVTPLRNDYHPVLRRVWAEEETPVSLVLRFVSGIKAACEQLSVLGWNLPDPTARAQKFETFWQELCESAAGPGLSKAASA